MLFRKINHVLDRHVIVFCALIFFLARESEFVRAADTKGAYDSIFLATDPQQLVFGKDDAPVTVIEYTALTCAHCAYFHNIILPEIRKKYIDTGKVRFVFRHFPIDHYSLKATAIVNQVPLPKRLATIDRIFAEQKNWMGEQAVEKLAHICNLPADKCQKVVSDQEILNQALHSRLEVEKIASVEGTPTFFIDGKMYSMTLTLAEFDKIMEQKKLPSQ